MTSTASTAPKKGRSIAAAIRRTPAYLATLNKRLTDDEMRRVFNVASKFYGLSSKERQYAMGLIAKLYTRGLS